jgi:hypothetical protein
MSTITTKDGTGIELLKPLCLGVAVLLGVALGANGVFMLVSPNIGTSRCPA